MYAQGRPRIAYITEDYEGESSSYNSLFYGWCEVNCQSTDGQWQHKRVENSSNLIAEWDVDHVEPCGGGWWGGQVPDLALAPTGGLHIAYDTYYAGPCEYNEASNTWQPKEFEQLMWRTVHVISSSQP